MGNLDPELSDRKINRRISYVAFILGFFMPPLAVYLVRQKCDGHVALAGGLFLLFWIPGIVYAWNMIIVYDHNEEWY
ncbi:hypothetical protein SNEBB_006656 [Seison nebaliae]|nr:hypothetical protein SNEBB_006656 [Seison nebaliae]